MSFQSPLLLVSLVVPALAAAGYLWLERRPSRFAVTFPNVPVLAAVASRRRSWRRHLVAAFLLTSLAALCVGLARPEMTFATPYEKATVVLVLDVSGSMRAEDVKPTRLEAARAALRRFLDELPRQIRVGVIAFSNTPEVVTTPTTDRARAREAVDVLLPRFGTAIGDAVARGAELARDAVADETGAAPKTRDGEAAATVVFLSDGFQTQGVLTPDEGAANAKRLGVAVYTVALGTDEGIIEVNRDGEMRIIPVPPDREALARIAEITDGEAYDVRNAERLREVYENLGGTLGRVDRPHEVTVAFVGVGAALLVAASALAGLWLPRLP